MSFNNSFKHLTLKEIYKVIKDLGKLSESTLNPHSLVLIISNSGQTIFTRSGWRILTEAGCGSPIAKIIINTAKKYTNYCGEDCKFILFILKEIMSAVECEISRDESFARIEMINNIASVKQLLPCIFDSIRQSPDARLILDSISFSEKLHSIIQTFMLSRFSKRDSNSLSIILRDFILRLICGKKSVKVIIEYVVSHFDYFCSKLLSPLSESQVLEGFVFFNKSIASNLELQNSKFIIIWDLSMSSSVNDVMWKVCSDSFLEEWNLNHVYLAIFRHFKQIGVELILTPSTADKDMKLLCEKNGVCLLDRLDGEDVENILSCINICPLGSLSDELESKHMGELKSFKAVSISSNSCFLNLQCTNPERFLSVHHIILSAPFDAVWKEYFSECLNCLKMIQQWICAKSSFQANSVVVGKGLYLPYIDKKPSCKNTKPSSKLDIKLDISKTNLPKVKDSEKDTSIEQWIGSKTSVVMDKSLNISCNNINPCSSSELDINLDALKKSLPEVVESEKHKWIGHKSSVVIDNSLSTACNNISPCSSSELGVNLDNLKIALSDVAESEKDTSVTLPPVLWEIMFLNFLEKAKMSISCRSFSQKLHFAIVKMACTKMGVLFCSVKNLNDTYAAFAENSNGINRLEPVICNEIMIYTVLDLLVQLLKIDGVIGAK